MPRSTTHLAMTPLDLVKCRLQVKPDLYKGVIDGWRTISKAEGASGVFTGFGATFIGYSFQGAGKYGLYEYFKYKYAQIVGEENAHKYRGFLYLGASASAEFFADIFLCPWEAIKVRQQTSYPPFARSVLEGFNKMSTNEGFSGFYKGIVPLWGRQIPYTMMKFASFETTVEIIYKTFLSKPKQEYNKLQQVEATLCIIYVSDWLIHLFCFGASWESVSQQDTLPVLHALQYPTLPTSLFPS